MTHKALQPRVHRLRWSALGGTLIRVGFVLIMAYVVLLGGGFGGTQVLGLRILNLGLAAVVLLTWAVVSWRHPSWRPRTAIWPAIVVPLAAVALTTALSRYPRLGLEYLTWAALLMALYLLLVRIMAVPSMREQMGAWAALLGFVVGIQYLAIVGTGWLDWWGLIGHLAVPMLRPAYAGLTFGGPTIVAPVMVLLTAAAFGGLAPTSIPRRLVLATLAALMLVVVVLTGSRAQPGLALGVAAVLTGAALLVVYRSRIDEVLRNRRWRRVAMATAPVVIPIAIVAAPAILARVAAPGDGGRGSYVAAGMRMFEDSPLLGTGTGTGLCSERRTPEPGEVDYYVNHAHNIYVQTLAEMGVVGALAGIIVVITVSWLVMRGLRAVDPSRRRWAWAALFGLVYLACNSLLDFYANMPVVMLAAAVPIAVLDASSERPFGLPGLSPRADRVTRRIGQGVFWVACVLSILVLWRTESIATSHDAAVAAVRTGDWEAARSAAEVAATVDPDMIPYAVTRAMAASVLGDWQTAQESYQKAALVDDLPANWLGLAQAQAALGMPATDVAASI